MKEWISGLADKFKDSPNKLRLAVVLGALGMLMILLSEVLPEKKKEVPETDAEQVVCDEDTELFKRQTEQELKEMLEQIQGVGSCEVMVTVEGTTEYVYAENISRNTDENADRKSDRLDETVVVIESNGDKQALVRRVIKPQIGGVMIVCEGGGNTRVNERVLKAVSTALNISSSRVCVEAKRR